MISLMWTLKNKINKQNRNRFRDAENTLMTTRWEGVGGRAEKVKELRLVVAEQSWEYKVQHMEYSRQLCSHSVMVPGVLSFSETPGKECKCLYQLQLQLISLFHYLKLMEQ